MAKSYGFRKKQTKDGLQFAQVRAINLNGHDHWVISLSIYTLNLFLSLLHKWITYGYG